MKKLLPALILGLFSTFSQAELPESSNLLKQAQKSIKNIDTKTLKSRLKANKNLLLIDIRTEAEVNKYGRIDAPQNINIPRGWLEFRLPDEITKQTEIILYCGTNRRSPLATQYLQTLGYKNVHNYAQGFYAWQKSGEPVAFNDNALNSALFNLPIQVSDRIWSAIGNTGPVDYHNAGHNNNLSFVIGDKSVLVFNAGGSYNLAKALHTEIKKITDLPVSFVVLENIQGHAMLGSPYWQEQGAVIIAHESAQKYLTSYGKKTLGHYQKTLKDKAQGSAVAVLDKTFKDKLSLDLGGLVVQARHFGSGHSPEDIALWIPSEKIMITGDYAFNQRMLPIFEGINISDWLKSWQKMVQLGAKTYIPGHGMPTELKNITHFTYDYLNYILQKVTDLLDNDGGLADAYQIDQSHYSHWANFQALHRQNISRVFKELEFE